jgi:hypothetical protein
MDTFMKALIQSERTAEVLPLLLWPGAKTPGAAIPIAAP